MLLGGVQVVVPYGNPICLSKCQCNGGGNRLTQVRLENGCESGASVRVEDQMPFQVDHQRKAMTAGAVLHWGRGGTCP